MENIVLEAVILGNIEKLEECIEKGYKLNTPFREYVGYTALQTAVIHKKREVVEFLLLKDADPNYPYTDKSPLKIAILLGDLKTINILLENNADCNCLFEAINSNDINIVEMILNYTKNLDYNDGRGFTPLMRAAILNREDTVESLIDFGFDVNKRDDVGYSLIDYALEEESNNVLRLLLNFSDLFDNDGKIKLKAARLDLLFV